MEDPYATLEPDEIIQRSSAYGIVAVQLKLSCAGGLYQRRKQSLPAFRGKYSGSILKIDSICACPRGHFPHSVGKVLVGVNGTDAEHDSGHDLCALPGHYLADPAHLIHVVHAVVDPEALNAVPDQGLDPQVHQRVWGEPELCDTVVPRSGSQCRGWHPLPPEVEPLPRILVVVPHHALEQRARGYINASEPSPVDVLRRRRRHSGADPHAPQA